MLAQWVLSLRLNYFKQENSRRSAYEAGLFFLLLAQGTAPGLPFHFVPHGVPQEWHLNIRLAGHLMMPFGVTYRFLHFVVGTQWL
jgi:hypothetical protein